MRDDGEVGIRRQRPKGEYSKKDKAIVFGMMERGGRVRTQTVPDTIGKTLLPLLAGKIDLSSSRLMTGNQPGYRGISRHPPHGIIFGPTIAHVFEPLL